MIKVLLVEDSQTIQEFLTYVLNKDSEISVIGVADHGKKAIEFLEKKTPDIIVMDIHMPTMGGFEATQQILKKYPIPILMISASWTPADIEKTAKVLEVGAVSILRKPSGLSQQEEIRHFIETVKLMSEIKIVTRNPRFKSASQESPKSKSIVLQSESWRPKVIVIGASLGGPNALKTILEKLQLPFPIPLLIVQHITSGFTQELVQWLQLFSLLSIQIAREGSTLEPGVIFFAPDNFHLRVKTNQTLSLTTDPAENGFRPSVSYLFRSVAEVFGANAIGVLLTGMGHDGSKELKLLKDQGAFTIAQDQSTSVIHSMPGEAIRLKGASMILPIEEIALRLNAFVQKYSS